MAHSFNTLSVFIKSNLKFPATRIFSNPFIIFYIID